MQRPISIAAAVLSLVLAGCGTTPVAPGAAPARAKLTGYTYGSGNAAGTQPEQTSTATAPAVAVEADTTSKGGYTYGSGN